MVLAHGSGFFGMGWVWVGPNPTQPMILWVGSDPRPALSSGCGDTQQTGEGDHRRQSGAALSGRCEGKEKRDERILHSTYLCWLKMGRGRTFECAGQGASENR